MRLLWVRCGCSNHRKRNYHMTQQLHFQGYIAKRMERRVSKSSVYIPLHSIIHNSQKVGASQTPTHQQGINHVVYTYKEFFFFTFFF